MFFKRILEQSLILFLSKSLTSIEKLFALFSVNFINFDYIEMFWEIKKFSRTVRYFEYEILLSLGTFFFFHSTKYIFLKLLLVGLILDCTSRFNHFQIVCIEKIFRLLIKNMQIGVEWVVSMHRAYIEIWSEKLMGFWRRNYPFPYKKGTLFLCPLYLNSHAELIGPKEDRTGLGPKLQILGPKTISK